MLYTCPVRALTPEIEHVLAVFAATHEQVATGGSVYYRQACLPRGGGALDQDAWTMQALAATRAIYNDVLREHLDRLRSTP